MKVIPKPCNFELIRCLAKCSLMVFDSFFYPAQVDEQNKVATNPHLKHYKYFFVENIQSSANPTQNTPKNNKPEKPFHHFRKVGYKNFSISFSFAIWDEIFHFEINILKTLLSIFIAKKQQRPNNRSATVCNLFAFGVRYG